MLAHDVDELKENNLFAVLVIQIKIKFLKFDSKII